MPAVRDDGVTSVIAIILLVAMTVIFATVTGAVLLSTSSSVGSAKILSVSAEGGTSEIPVFVHLNAGTDLEKLVRVYAYDAAGNNFAVTKTGAVFSPGLVLETNQVMLQSGGPQMVSLTGEFTDGTKQLLWEGELTLAEGGEIVSAEAGTAEIPVLIHLTAGGDLEKLVKVYARDEAGNKFAVTKPGAVFSPGVVLETEQMMCQSGGPQMVSLYGEFTDGTEQLLWEGELTLVEGREIVWMKFREGSDLSKTIYSPPYSGHDYYEWQTYPVTSTGSKIGGSVYIRFIFTIKDSYYGYIGKYLSKDTLVIIYSNATSSIYNDYNYVNITNPSDYNEYTKIEQLYSQFPEINMILYPKNQAGKITMTGSDQIFKTYTG